MKNMKKEDWVELNKESHYRDLQAMGVKNKKLIRKLLIENKRLRNKRKNEKVTTDDAEGFLQQKGIFNHPYIYDNDGSAIDLTELLVEFGNRPDEMDKQKDKCDHPFEQCEITFGGGVLCRKCNKLLVENIIDY